MAYVRPHSLITMQHLRVVLQHTSQMNRKQISRFSNLRLPSSVNKDTYKQNCINTFRTIPQCSTSCHMKDNSMAIWKNQSPNPTENPISIITTVWMSSTIYQPGPFPSHSFQVIKSSGHWQSLACMDKHWPPFGYYTGSLACKCTRRAPHVLLFKVG